jgi:hypothetical protein
MPFNWLPVFSSIKKQGPQSLQYRQCITSGKESYSLHTGVPASQGLPSSSPDHFGRWADWGLGQKHSAHEWSQDVILQDRILTSHHVLGIIIPFRQELTWTKSKCLLSSGCPCLSLPVPSAAKNRYCSPFFSHQSSLVGIAFYHTGLLTALWVFFMNCLV